MAEALVLVVALEVVSVAALVADSVEASVEAVLEVVVPVEVGRNKKAPSQLEIVL